MDIIEKIKCYEEENISIEQTKVNLINSHVEQINKVIEDKIIKLQEELKESAILEVCGTEYKVLEEGIAKNNKYISLLKEIQSEDGFVDVLKDIVKYPENTAENNETEASNEIQGEPETMAEQPLEEAKQE